MKRPFIALPQRLSRRSVLHGIIGSAAGVALADLAIISAVGAASSGCADEAAPPKPYVRPIATIRKSLHIAFPLGAAALLREEIHRSRLVAKVGRHTFSLRNHDAASLAKAAANPFLRRTEEPLTHYVDGTTFSAEAVQSFSVQYRLPNGLCVPLLGGVHIPSARDVLRSKDNGVLNDDDPTTLSVDDATIWAIYHDPGLISFDPATATAVVAAARGLTEYQALRYEIKKRLSTVTAQGLESANVWVQAQYDLDDAGQKIPFTDLQGAIVNDASGAPVYYSSWVPQAQVRSATAALVSATTTQLNSNPAMEGVKYLNVPGRDGATVSVTGVRGVKSTSREYACFDTNLTQSRRQVEVEIEGNSLAATLTNHSALATVLLVEAITPDGPKKIGVGFAPAVFFPGIPFPPDAPYQTETKVDVEIPDDANEVNVWTIAPAFNRGGCSDLLSQATTESYIGVWVLSAAVDFFLPTSLMVAGAINPESAHTFKELLKEAATHLFEEGGLELVMEALLALIGKGQSFAEKMAAEGEVLMSALIKLVSRSLPKFFGGAFVAILAELYIASAAANAIPIVGWALEIVGAAQTLVQLGFATEHLFSNQGYTVHRAVGLRAVDVVVGYTAGDAQFPERAAKYKVVLTPLTDDKAFLPLTEEGSFDSSQPKFDVAFEKVPELAFNVTVSLYDRQGAEVSTGSAKFTDQLTQNPFTAAIATQGIPFVVNSTSALSHARLLSSTESGRQWSGSAGAPVAAPGGDDRDLSSDPRLGRVSSLLGLTFSQQRQVLAYNFVAPTDATSLSSLVYDVGRTTANVNAGMSSIIRSRTLVHSLADYHCLVDHVDDVTLAVFGYDPGTTNLSTFNAQAEVANGTFGTLHGRSVIHARIHKDAGTLCAATDFGLEFLPITKLSTVNRSSVLVSRRGSRLGQIDALVAVAPFRTAHKVAVLDAGANNRIHVFDLQGNPMVSDTIVYLKNNPNDPFSKATLLDLEVDSGGNYWVMALDATQSDTRTFYLRVLDPAGRIVNTFVGIHAFRLALNLFNELYTLNAFSTRPRGQSYDEPTLSVWLPH